MAGLQILVLCVLVRIHLGQLKNVAEAPIFRAFVV
jgi:hypothetical protein